MTPRERQILDQTAQMLRMRRLWKEYRLEPFRQEAYPAPLLDAMLQLDAIEAAVVEDRSKR